MRRVRSVRLLTSWVFVAALLLKGAVPMLATAAAILQGKPLAEVCDVYGVDMSMLRANAGAATGTAPHAHGSSREAPQDVHPEAHEAHQAHQAHQTAPHAVHGAAEHDAPTRVAHGADHCALSALAFALPAGPVAIVPAPPVLAPALAARSSGADGVDAAARWAAQLQHGPPAFS